MTLAHRTQVLTGLILAALLLVGASQPALAGSVRTLTLSSGGSLAANDDGYSTAQPMGFTINFFGVNYSNAYISNNGLINFDAGTSAWIPMGLQTYAHPTIAAFWADVDTRAPGSGLTTWGQAMVNGHKAFVVNWPHVGQYNQNGTYLNTFQIVLIDRSDTGAGNFDIELNYDLIGWDHGGAGVGYTNGLTPPTYYELPGSNTPSAFITGGSRDLVANSNVGTPGRYIFEARNGNVSANPTPSVPLPPTLVLVGTGLLGYGALRLRRRRRA
ncbi:MAG: nidogen-like domain-containing protein [Bryobacteraceae bacterium]